MQDGTPGSSTSVYCYFDTLDMLIYVGITSRGMARNVEHDRSKNWWRFVARQTIEHYATYAAAHRREIELIGRHNPPFNVQHNPRHAEMRDLYSALTDSRVAGDPIEVHQAIAGWLPLDLVQDNGAGNIIVRTSVEHAPIVRRLRYSLPVRFVQDGGHVAGRVCSVEIAGPFAIIDAQLELTAPRDGLTADVRRVPEKGGPQFNLRRVKVPIA